MNWSRIRNFVIWPAVTAVVGWGVAHFLGYL